MRRCCPFIALILLLALAGCASKPPLYRHEAIASLERVRGEGESLLPAQYASMLEAYQKGESLLERDEADEAERYFQLALLKGNLLEVELAAEKERRAQAARLAEERRRAELERQAREEAERAAQARAQALAHELAQAQAQAQREAAELERRRAKAQREHVLVNSYTVRRGETLPLIASQPEVYGDRTLWPLIYRANRSQIRDPRHIWPGQVLRIPRNLGRDDIAEARRYSQERALH